MSELDKLKKENKKLMKLLRNAVELLNKYKDVLTHEDPPGSRRKKRNARDNLHRGQPASGDGFHAGLLRQARACAPPNPDGRGNMPLTQFPHERK